MKKIILAIVGLCFLKTTEAQLIKKSATFQKPAIQKPHNNNGNNQQTPTSTPALTDADYFLGVAKITIKTGKDNKELNSKLILRVYPNAGTDNWRKGYELNDYKDVLKTWSTNSFTLPRSGGFDKSFNSLANYKQDGVMVDIFYDTFGNGPFCLLDAWKIEEVSVTLEFKDVNGNPHPTFGSKTIYFSGSDMYLDYQKWHLFCKTDQYFNTLPTFILRRDS
mgnify:CR=1 FL=1